jgi:hypothetical protein
VNSGKLDFGRSLTLRLRTRSTFHRMPAVRPVTQTESFAGQSRVYSRRAGKRSDKSAPIRFCLFHDPIPIRCENSCSSLCAHSQTRQTSLRHFDKNMGEEFDGDD